MQGVYVPIWWGFGGVPLNPPIGLFPVQATNALLPIAGHCWKQPSNERSSSSDDLGGEQLKMLAQRFFVVKGLEPTRFLVVVA